MSAPATNLEELFNFEGNFENIAQDVLDAAGVTAYLTSARTNIPLLSTGIAADLNPALDLLTEIPKPTNWPADTAAPQEYFRYTLRLNLRVEVPRDDNTPTSSGVWTMLEQVRSKIRAAFMRSCMPFNPTNCPLYRVSDIKPNGTTTGTEGQGRKNLDFTDLGFVVTFSIVPDAWPAWVET